MKDLWCRHNNYHINYCCSEFLPVAIYDNIIAILFESGFSKREIKSYVRRLKKDMKMQLFQRLLFAYGGDAFLEDSIKLCQKNANNVQSVLCELRSEGVIEQLEDEELERE